MYVVLGYSSAFASGSCCAWATAREALADILIAHREWELRSKRSYENRAAAQTKRRRAEAKKRTAR